MNTPEKYITAYAFATLTGIKGSSWDRVIEVMKGSDFSIDDPFLRLVYDIARYDPESKNVQDAVAGITMGQIMLTNKPIQEAFTKTIEEAVKERAAESKKPQKKVRLICEEYDEMGYFTTVATSGDEVVLEATMSLPSKYSDLVIEKFKEKFPEGEVVKEG